MTTETPPLDITYQQQNYVPGTRQCGAACLSMVYESLNQTVPQEGIWRAIAKEDRFGTIGARTHLMVKDALSRGFSAVAVQTNNPVEALRQSWLSGIRVIINHLLERGKPVGHYSVLLHMDDRYAYVHDPQKGPAQRLSHADLMELWAPQGPDSEIAGYVLIGIGSAAQNEAKTACPHCKFSVPVPPAPLFACMIICPSCDRVWPCEGSTPPAAVKFDLAPMFAQLDKFSALVKSVPGMAAIPEIGKHLDALALQKQNILAAVHSFGAAASVRKQQMAEMEQSAHAAKEAHERKLAEAKTAMQPLDGHKLGLAFLKSVGVRTAADA